MNFFIVFLFAIVQSVMWRPPNQWSAVIFKQPLPQYAGYTPSDIKTFWYCHVTDTVQEGRPTQHFYDSLDKPSVAIVKDNCVFQIKGYNQKWINALLRYTDGKGYGRCYQE